MDDMMKLSELLGEGFLADRIAKGNLVEASKYAIEIRRGREITASGYIGSDPLRCLHRYLRFLTWLLLNYGSITFKSKAEADSFLNQKICAICNQTSDFESFWEWLRRVTLAESSALMPQP